MEAALVGAVVLVVLLVVASRRWGPPRMYRPVTVALWVGAAIFGLILLSLTLN